MVVKNQDRAYPPHLRGNTPCTSLDLRNQHLRGMKRREELLMMQSRYLRSIFENDIRKSGTLYSLEAPAEMEKFLPEMT